MLDRLRSTLILGLCVALLLAVGYWNIRPQSFLDDLSSGTTPPQEVDFFAIGSRTVQYQPDGSLDYLLTADRISHLKTSDLTVLTDPVLRLYRGEEQPWQVSSLRGEVAPGGDSVELIDQVRIAHTDTRGRPIVITTSRMTVQPEKQYAQTRQAVRIVAANGVTTATGMNAYLDEGRIRLLSHVRGQHELR